MVWMNAVKRQYEMGVLNSERALQACLVGAFAPLAPDIVTLVEPQLSSRIVPDVWIGYPGGRTIAVIEIKYVPHDYPKWEKDLPNLTTVLSATDLPAYDTHPVDGRNGLPMRCNSETLGIFAVIGKHDADAVNSETLGRRLAEAGSLFSEAQRATFPRILHAWGAVRETTREFGMDWVDRTTGDRSGSTPRAL
jgi:hypothetical protein